MNRFIATIFLLTLSGAVPAQERNIVDSVLRVMNEKQEDTLLVKQYIALTRNYLLIKPDSSIYYGNKAILLADKLNYTFWKAYAYRNQANAYKILGDYPNAWDCLQKAKKQYAEMKDENNIEFLEFAGGTLNWTQGEYEEALKIFIQFKPKAEANQKFDLAALYVFMASCYNELKKPDSGLYYIRMAILKGVERKDDLSWIYSIAGDSYLQTNRADSAIYYYNLSRQIATNPTDIIHAAIGIAKFFRLQGNRDSCIWYAKSALDESESRSFRDNAKAAASILAEVYENNDPQASIKYYKLAAALDDSLFGQQKIRQVQSVKFSEQIHTLEQEEKEKSHQAKLFRYLLIVGISSLSLIALILVYNNRQKQRSNTKIRKAYAELKNTQQQLVQSEKMASLGELTAGIAHEIQNPLNFVNNFSEVSNELLDEMKTALDKGDTGSAKEIAGDVIENMNKIILHGKRADGIVKSMLQHSRTGSRHKEMTDINMLCDEYIRLSYHGLKARDKSFNSNFETFLDPSVGKLNVVPQEIGRVILNLINNAFYAVTERKKLGEPGYEPRVTVTTKMVSPGSGGQGHVEISVSDNGTGIPQKLLDKIFQPFFTTKPTGQGTGLGLSLSYDIITKGHGGDIKVNTTENVGTQFIITLLLKNGDVTG